MRSGWCAIAGLAMFMLASVSHAALVSFDLNQSNALPDGQVYLRVTIDDQGLPGSIRFNVTLLEPLIGIAGRNFGIQSFGFNSAFHLRDANVIGLPPEWSLQSSRRMSEFGVFDYMLQGRGRERVTSLSFSVIGISTDTLLSYLTRSSGEADQRNEFFAAHVAGLNGQSATRHGWDDNTGHGRSNDEQNYPDRIVFDRGVAGAYFAGSTPTPLLPTPLPPAAWLLLAGILAFMPFLKRNSIRRAPTGVERAAG
jgi:hypothetical protein